MCCSLEKTKRPQLYEVMQSGGLIMGVYQHRHGYIASQKKGPSRGGADSRYAALIPGMVNMGIIPVSMVSKVTLWP